jgi:phosphomevalonate kinase
MEEPTNGNGHRMSRVINRDYVKRWALDYCRDHEMVSRRKFKRVSEAFLNMIEAATKSAIIHRIESHPSKGQTLR